MERNLVGTNFFAEQNPNVNIAFTNELGFATVADGYGNPNTVAVESNLYNTGCFYTNNLILSGNNVYINQGTLTSPNWVLIGSGGGGGIAIGDPVTGGDPNDVLFVDASGNLGQNDSFYYIVGNSFQVGFPNYAPFYGDNSGNVIVGDYFQDYLNGTGIYIDGSADTMFIGNDGTSNGTAISIVDTAQRITLNANNSILVTNLGGSGAGFVAVDNTGLLSFSAGVPASIAIGDAVTGGDAWDVLFIDGSGFLAQNDRFFYNSSIGTFEVGFDSNAIPITAFNTGDVQLGDWNVDIGSGLGFYTQQLSGTIQIGNDGIGGSANASQFLMTDSDQSLIYSSVLGTWMSIRPDIALGDSVFNFGDVNEVNTFQLAIDYLPGRFSLHERSASLGDILGNFDNSVVSVYEGGLANVSGMDFQTNYGGSKNPLLQISGGTFGDIIMGDINGVVNATTLEVNDSGQSIILTAVSNIITSLGGSGSGFVAVDNSGLLSFSGGVPSSLAIGDTITGSSPGSVLFVDSSGNLGQNTNFVYDPLAGNFQVSFAGASLAGIPITGYDTGDIQLGDYNIDVVGGMGVYTEQFSALIFVGNDGVGGAANGNRLEIDDANDIISFSSGGSEYFYLNTSAGNYAIGDAQGQNTGTYLVISEAISGLMFYSNQIAPNSLYFNIDNSRNIYQLGDILSSNHGTYISVDDLNKLVTLTNVPTYANDAAATGAGLTTGQLYKTTTLGTTSLNIVP